MLVRLSKSLLVFSLLLSACASAPPFKIDGARLDTSPQQVVADFETLRGERVVWGGIIISSRNLESGTEIEVLSFPLESGDLWPNADAPAQGRFLVRHPGYLEPLDYAAGRYLTAVGELLEVRDIRVGETDVTYPVMAGGELHLWRGRPDRDSRVRFHFGLFFSN